MLGLTFINTENVRIGYRPVARSYWKNQEYVWNSETPFGKVYAFLLVFCSVIQQCLHSVKVYQAAIMRHAR